MFSLMRLFILCILIGFYSMGANATNNFITPVKGPGFIPILKKPCYIGCDYLFQFCYYYNISNMNDAITVREWNIEKDSITGTAAADIKAKLLIKVCYQLSLAAAYPFIDEELNLEAEFNFKMKVSGDTKEQCIDYDESTITYTSFELKGDMKTDPVPLMINQLGLDMKNIIQDSVSKAVYGSLHEKNKSKKFYCGEHNDELYESNIRCQCD